MKRETENKFIGICVLFIAGIVLFTVGFATNKYFSDTVISNMEATIDGLQDDVVDIGITNKRYSSILRDVFGEWYDDKPVLSTMVTVSCYSSRVKETDSTPHTTSDLSNVMSGIIAISPDMRSELNLQAGQRVLLVGYGVFEIHDTMNRRWKRRVDIWMPDTVAASRHGVKETLIVWQPKTN